MLLIHSMIALVSGSCFDNCKQQGDLKFSIVYDLENVGVDLQGTGPNIKHFRNRKHVYNNELLNIKI